MVVLIQMKEILIDLNLEDFVIQIQEHDKIISYCVSHLASGAKGISGEAFSELENKKQALLRCINSKHFQKWYKKHINQEQDDLVDINTWLRMNCLQ